MPPWVLLAALVAAVSPTSPSLAVSPTSAGRHDRVAVAFTSQRATGVFGRTRRSYIVEAHAVRPGIDCVSDRERAVSERPAGTRMRARLDPALGEGGESGWCPGRFRGTVTYVERYACPSRGTCHPPEQFPERTRVVARFSFRVA